MTRVYSVCLAHDRFTSSGPHELYVPDDSIVAVVRDISFYVEIGGGTGEVGVYVQSGIGGTDPVFIYKVQSATDAELYQWHGHQVLRLGDALMFWNDMDHANVRVSGYELTRLP